MAFMGMVFGAIFVIILIIVLSIVALCFVIGIICKIIGKVKDSRGARIAGTVFFVIALVLLAPVIALFVYGYFSTAYWTVNMPDGSTSKIHHSTATEFRDSITDYIDNGDEDALEHVESMIEDNEALVYLRDNNHAGILEYGLEAGSADIVRLALDNGAPVDSPDRFENMAYIDSTWEEFLNEASVRTITQDDIEIAQMLFDADCDTSYDSNVPYYSNLFGKAVWAVLYNDDEVTDTEIGFLEVFTGNGLDSDSSLMLVYEVPSNYLFGPETHEGVERDDNYYHVLEMAGLSGR